MAVPGGDAVVVAGCGLLVVGCCGWLAAAAGCCYCCIVVFWSATPRRPHSKRTVVAEAGGCVPQTALKAWKDPQARVGRLHVERHPPITGPTVDGCARNNWKLVLLLVDAVAKSEIAPRVHLLERGRRRWGGEGREHVAVVQVPSKDVSASRHALLDAAKKTALPTVCPFHLHTLLDATAVRDARRTSSAIAPRC